MAHMEHVKPFGATTATVTRITQPHHRTRRRVIAVRLSEEYCGTTKEESIQYHVGENCTQAISQLSLRSEKPGKGQCVTYTATVNDHQVQACQFRDLKFKDIVSTCSSSIAGKPRKTKHHGLVPHPHVAEYLKYSASINVHNHYHTGSVALEDIWHTKNPHRRQLAGILGFYFTNGYLAMKYFSNSSLPHHQFKMAAANALVA